MGRAFKRWKWNSSFSLWDSYIKPFVKCRVTDNEVGKDTPENMNFPLSSSRHLTVLPINHLLWVFPLFMHEFWRAPDISLLLYFCGSSWDPDSPVSVNRKYVCKLLYCSLLIIHSATSHPCWTTYYIQKSNFLNVSDFLQLLFTHTKVCPSFFPPSASYQGPC